MLWKLCLKFNVNPLIWNEDVRVKYNVISRKIICSRVYSPGNIVVSEFCILSNNVDDDKEYIFETDTLKNNKSCHPSGESSWKGFKHAGIMKKKRIKVTNCFILFFELLYL
jgi:hypothetical protein